MNNPRAVVLLALAAAAGVLLYLLAPILTPFLFGALLAYIANPMVMRLTRWHIPRALAVALVFTLFVAVVAVLLVFLVPLIQRQVTGFAHKMPQYLDWVQTTLLPQIERAIGQPLPVDFADLRAVVVANWQEIANVVRATVTDVMMSSFRIGLWLVNLALIPIVTFYLLLDWDKVLKNTLGLFPPAARPTIRRLARESDEVLGSFLRGQLLVMLSLAVINSAGLWIIGLDLALPIGIVSGLICFVPYLGFIVGAGAGSIAAYLQFQEPTVLLWVLLVFAVSNLIESYVLSPRLVGNRVGLHPVAVIFSILAMGSLFGFLGVLLALPAAAVLKVWLRWLHQSYVMPAAKPRRPAARVRPVRDVTGP